MPFTHLEVHSHFTLLGATASPADLVARAASEGMTHLALTDTNALYGAVAFARAARSAGVKPIIGMTLTVAPPASLWEGAGPTPPGQLVLLAHSPEGYRSLCRLSSMVQGSPERELTAAEGLAWDAVVAHREGLICLSGGRSGWLYRLLEAEETGAAHAVAGIIAGAFDDHAVLTIELGRPADTRIAAQITDLGRRLGLPVAAVQPVYTLEPGDAVALRLLHAIRGNQSIGETPAEALARLAAPETSDVHWLSEADVGERFTGFPGAVAATAKIAAKCGDVMPDGAQVWPAISLPPGQTPNSALAQAARAGLVRRYGASVDPDVASRLDAELDAITRQGFAPIFLIVADLVRFARSREIPVSTRGSVANSLVAYCSEITTVDPIEHGLLFERFLNPARSSPPDIDMDFCSRRRDEVLSYVRERYGADRVAIIGTISTLRPQSAVREAGKALGLDAAATGRLAALMPDRWHPDPRRRAPETPAQKVEAISDPELQAIARHALSIVGQPDHLSMHPGGVVITPGPITDYAPVQWSPKGFLITQYEHGDVEELGLPKIDLLGIRALTVLADAAEMVRAAHQPGFRLDAIPLDDPQTGDLLARGETIGVFQCESDGAQRTLRKLRARSVRDLAIANAFFKPGPATGGMADAFVRRYRGEEPVSYLHPALAPILGPTKGVLIFQEQVLRVVREIAGLSWAEADQIRRGMSKFRPEDLSSLQQEFLAGCRRPAPVGHDLTQSQAEALWTQVEAFSGYGFNQGHATAYADVSFRSAYLKAHFPAEFLSARLADWGGYHHPAVYMAEATRLGFIVHPPHVNRSQEQFSLSDGALWMGLGQVRELRRSAIAAITVERRSGPYDSLRDLTRRVDLQPKELNNLIRCGALDGLGPSRAAQLAEAGSSASGKGASSGQLTFDLGTPDVAKETPSERLIWESEILGWPVSVSPLQACRQPLPAHEPLGKLAIRPGKPVTTLGFRLPGWSGGPGFLLGDGDSFVTARLPREAKSPPAWQPLLLRGRWITDEYGSSWFQADEARSLPA